jgi:hypothetical protein
VGPRESRRPRRTASAACETFPPRGPGVESSEGGFDTAGWCRTRGAATAAVWRGPGGWRGRAPKGVAEAGLPHDGARFREGPAVGRDRRRGDRSGRGRRGDPCDGRAAGRTTASVPAASLRIIWITSLPEGGGSEFRQRTAAAGRRASVPSAVRSGRRAEGNGRFVQGGSTWPGVPPMTGPRTMSAVRPHPAAARSGASTPFGDRGGSGAINVATIRPETTPAAAAAFRAPGPPGPRPPRAPGPRPSGPPASRPAERAFTLE